MAHAGVVDLRRDAGGRGADVLYSLPIAWRTWRVTVDDRRTVRRSARDHASPSSSSWCCCVLGVPVAFAIGAAGLAGLALERRVSAHHHHAADPPVGGLVRAAGDSALHLRRHADGDRRHRGAPRPPRAGARRLDPRRPGDGSGHRRVHLFGHLRLDDRRRVGDRRHHDSAHDARGLPAGAGGEHRRGGVGDGHPGAAVHPDDRARLDRERLGGGALRRRLHPGGRARARDHGVHLLGGAARRDRAAAAHEAPRARQGRAAGADPARAAGDHLRRDSRRRDDAHRGCLARGALRGRSSALFVYREIKWRDLPAIMARSAVVTAPSVSCSRSRR